jgi:hypothetical protein
MKTYLMLALIGATVGCAQKPAEPPTPSPSVAKESPNAPAATGPTAAAEEDVLEAVFRYQFAHNASGIQQAAARYCISFPGDKAPSEGFLSRFARNLPPVAAADQCDRTTGKDLFFQAKAIEWEGDSTAVVHGGYWEGNLSSSGETFRVVREEGRWVVKDARLEAMS